MSVLNIGLNALGRFVYLLSPVLRSSGFRIIYYHMVSDQKHSFYWPEKQIGSQEFRRQLKFLTAIYKFISLSEAVVRAEKGEDLSGYCCLTTDDGFSCNYDHIYPIAKEFGIKPTFFLIGECLNNKMLMWRNIIYMIVNEAEVSRVNEIAKKATIKFSIQPKRDESLFDWSENNWPMALKQEIANFFWQELNMPDIGQYLQENTPYLTSDQIKEMHNDGVEFGLHSATHPYFSKLSYTEALQELQSCTQEIDSIIQRDYAEVFAYPFGYRALQDVEVKLSQNMPEVKGFLGIKSANRNGTNPLKWERDKMELPFFASLARFYVLPLVRQLKGGA